MKSFTVLTLGFFASLGIDPAFAQVAYQLPTVYQITGHSCGAPQPGPYVVTGFDANTSTYTGLVYAKTSCSSGGRGAPPTWWTGCAATVWDSTGVLLSYSVEWRASGRTATPSSACVGS